MRFVFATVLIRIFSVPTIPLRRHLWILGTLQLAFASDVNATKQVFCKNQEIASWTTVDRPLKTCRPDVSAVGDENFIISSSDNLIEGIVIKHHKNVKFLPQNLVSFPELTGLNVYNCSIQTIEYNELQNLWKLRAIHFSYNHVAFVSSDAFKDLVSLEHLYLSDNKIQFLDANTFVSQRNLKVLFVGGNQINFLHPNIFKELFSVEAIHFDFNSIWSIDENIFANISTGP